MKFWHLKMGGIGLCLIASVAGATLPLIVKKAWILYPPGAAKNAALYLEISNPNDSSDTLIRAETPIAESISIHQMERKKNLQSMKKLSSVTISGRSSVSFTPEKMHLMLTHLTGTKRLVENQQYPITLIFEKSGSLQIMATVLGQNAPVPPQPSP